MTPEQFPEYVDIVARAREAWMGRVDVRLGMECDYFAGYEAWVEQQLTLAEFHYVIGSVHPQIDEYRDRYRSDDPVESQQTYFGLLADAAETGLFDSISHPDLIKNLTSKDWQPARIMPDICRALDRIAATGVAMELNTSGANKTIQEMNPFPEMLEEMHRREIPIVIGADAHAPGRVGDGFADAISLLERVGYETVRHFIDRQPHEVRLDAARASLRLD